MNLIRAAGVSMALAFSGAGLGAEKAPAPADSKQGKSDQLVCFAEKTTGSNLRKRICMTEGERAARRKADQEAMQNTRRSTAGSGVAGSRD